MSAYLHHNSYSTQPIQENVYDIFIIVNDNDKCLGYKKKQDVKKGGKDKEIFFLLLFKSEILQRYLIF